SPGTPSTFRGCACELAGSRQNGWFRTKRLRLVSCNDMHAYIEDLGKHHGEEVTLKGWLHNRRSSGKIHFLTVRDGSGFIQAVMSKQAVGEEAFKAGDHLAQESAVGVTGTVRADPRAKGGYELDVSSLEILSGSHD